MRGLMAISWVAFSALPVTAQEPAKPKEELTDAEAILGRTIDAMTKLKAVSYDMEYKVTGWFGKFLPNVRGSVVMGKESQHKVKRFRSTLKVEPLDGSAAVELTAGADGDIHYVVDPQTKTVYADIDPGVYGKNQFGIDLSLVREFGLAKPFEDTLNGGELRLEASSEVGGEDCYALWLKPKSEPGSTWFLSKRDFLPRRVSFSMKDEKGVEGGGELTLSKLVVNPTLPKDAFAVTVPEGYRKTDEFAP